MKRSSDLQNLAVAVAGMARVQWQRSVKLAGQTQKSECNSCGFSNSPGMRAEGHGT